MKILFYSYAYPNPLQPGLGTFNRAMVAGLAADHDVRVVSPVSFVDVWKGRLTGKLPNGLNDRNFCAAEGVPAEYLTHYYTPRLFRNQYGRWMNWSVQRRLKRTMTTFRPDLVLSYWTHPDGEVAVRTAHRHGVPAVAMVGGSDVLLLGRSGRRRSKILDVLQNADAVVTVSEDIASTLIRDGIDSRKLHTVRRGVDRALFSPGDQVVARRGLGIPETTAVLLCVGRLVPVKGLAHLLQACRLLAARRLPFRCYIVGEGPLQGDLRKQIRDLGLTGVVELKGSQTQLQLAEWYRAADVTVLPSLSEGVPNVLMESISCGTSFVATEVGGIPEVADRRHDRLVPPSCPVAMADAIEWQLKLRRDSLPPRSFEPLTLRAAAHRLDQVLEEVRSKSTSVSKVWKSFQPVMYLNRNSESQGVAACDMQNSLPGGLSALTRAVVSKGDAQTPAENEHWRGEICLPSSSLFSEELGRTGEEFVLPRT